MKLLNFTIIKLTLCLIIGIILANTFTVSLYFILSLTIGLLICVGIVYFITRKHFNKAIWFGLLAFITTISIGVLIVQLHDQRQFKNHYSNVISVDGDSTKLISFIVREILKPTAYHNKYVIDVFKVDEQTASGKLLLNISKDSTQNDFQVDDVLMISSTIEQLNSPLNPYQFNYKTYLEKQYIFHQISTTSQSLYKVQSQSNSLFGFADRIRSKINERLKNYHFKADELAIVNALLLGQRKDISKEIFDNYSHAGAIHILAVSGLHVGIILLLLNFAFKPLERLKHGKYYKIALIVICLWSFAIIAGMSASVTRAVTMFTIIAIGMNLKRPANIYNTLAISMFFLLLFKPLFLFDVGFQMSYLAVLSIVMIQPIFKKLWSTKNKPASYLWDIFTVTLSAQIGVLPISLFYFHQFPGLFFLSNLVILPFLGIILGFGIIVIILALLNILPQFVADIYGQLISIMNQFISWISHQEGFLFKDISFGIGFVLVSYLMIISLIALAKKPKFPSLAFVLISVLMIQAAFIFHKKDIQTNELVIFHKSKQTVIGLKENSLLTIAHQQDSIDILKENSIKNYKVGSSIKDLKSVNLQSVYSFNDKKILVIDSLGVYNVKSLQPDYILLRNSPKINLNRLIDSLKPQTIIADGSNYKSYVKHWKLTCEKQKTPFHLTSEKGAFIIK